MLYVKKTNSDRISGLKVLAQKQKISDASVKRIIKAATFEGKCHSDIIKELANNAQNLSTKSLIELTNATLVPGVYNFELIKSLLVNSKNIPDEIVNMLFNVKSPSYSDISEISIELIGQLEKLSEKSFETILSSNVVPNKFANPVFLKQILERHQDIPSGILNKILDATSWMDNKEDFNAVIDCVIKNQKTFL